MTLRSGSTFGQYEIEAPLGAGAMGDVYRARDPRLGRQVALKILKPGLMGDSHAVARFDREARALASVQHPHVACIYGVEESGSVRGLVMELVDGETLASRLSRGPLPWAEALRVARQIAAGIEAAHERGVVHRDLKPANVQLTRSGTVKVLDFGLARLLDPVGDSNARDATVTSVQTRVGTILGTTAYMSPEQARGELADARADIWAVGCILYEMLCGRRPFFGSTNVEGLAAILERDPDWNCIPKTAPRTVRRLLERCLRKDLMQRVQHAGDVRIEIDDILDGAVEPPASDGRRAWRVYALVATGIALVLLGMLARNQRLPRAGEQTRAADSVRTSIALPPDLHVTLSGMSILATSPDGTTLVFSALRNGRRQLYIRRLNEFDVQAIPDTDDGAGPFFSPDAKWIGFFAHGYMKKMALSGGAAVNIAPAPSARGAAWLADDTIVFTPEPDAGMTRVSAAGGRVSQLTTADAAGNEIAHRWPQPLPGRRAILFTVFKGIEADSVICALDLDSGQRKVLIAGGTDPHFVPGPAKASRGELVYVRDKEILAVAFDAEHLEVLGPPRRIETGARQTPTGATAATISQTGTMVYAYGDRVTSPGLVWVDRSGNEQPIEGLSIETSFPRLSSDGKQILLSKLYQGNFDVWIYDLESRGARRLTTDSAFDAAPLWSPDDKRIAFRSFRGHPFNIFWKPADGSSAEQRVTTAPRNQTAHAWTRRGYIVYSEIVTSRGRDLAIVGVDEGRTPKTLIEGLDGPVVGAPSPDDKWFAYTTAESGVAEVFLAPFDGQTVARSATQQLSIGGGTEPVWSRDGRDLYYRGTDHMMVAHMGTGRPPEQLFPDRYQRWGEFVNFALAPDGRFLMVRQPDPISLDLKVVTNILRQ